MFGKEVGDVLVKEDKEDEEMVKQVGRVVSFMENDNKNLAYFQHIKKSIKNFPMLKFSRWTPTLDVRFKWDSQKRGAPTSPFSARCFTTPSCRWQG